MQELAAVRRGQAVRTLEHMNIQAPEWGDYQAGSRAAVRQVLEDRMHGLLGTRIAESAAASVQDRHNGAYRRRLLTELLAALPLINPRVAVQRWWALMRRTVPDRVAGPFALASRRPTAHQPRRRPERGPGRSPPSGPAWNSRHAAAVRCLAQELDALFELLRFEDHSWMEAPPTALRSWAT